MAIELIPREVIAIFILIMLAHPVFIRIGWFLEANDIYLYLLTRDNIFQYFVFEKLFEL